jgi:hypothetical protein
VQIYAVNPTVSALSPVEIIFTADTDIPVGSKIQITYPVEFNPTLTGKKDGATNNILIDCAELFDVTNKNVKCVKLDATNKIEITGLFPTADTGIVGLNINQTTNPSAAGDIGTFVITLTTETGDEIA